MLRFKILGSFDNKLFLNIITKKNHIKKTHPHRLFDGFFPICQQFTMSITKMAGNHRQYQHLGYENLDRKIINDPRERPNLKTKWGQSDSEGVFSNLSMNISN